MVIDVNKALAELRGILFCVEAYGGPSRQQYRILFSDAVKLCIRAEHLRLSQDLLAE